MIHFYIGDASYSGGFFAERLSVPEDQIWVVKQSEGDLLPLWGNEGNGALPKLWQQHNAATVYKFRQSTNPDHIWSMMLFESEGIALRINLTTHALLHDPIIHVATGQFIPDNTPVLERALYDALYDPPLGSTGIQNAPPAPLPKSFRDLVPPICRRLLPDTDVSRYVDNLPAFRDRGLVVYVSIESIQRSPSYQQVLEQAEVALAARLLTIKQDLRMEAANLTPKVLDPYDHLYTMQLDSYDLIFPEQQPIIDDIIGKVQGQTAMTHPPSPKLTATIFNDILGQEIERSIQDARVITRARVRAAVTPPAINERRSQIEAIYTMGQRMGWLISPSQDAVRNKMVIRFTDNSDLTLIIPETYPQKTPLVPSVHNSNRARLPARQIYDVVAPIVKVGTYNLPDVVQAVADRVIAPQVDIATHETVSLDPNQPNPPGDIATHETVLLDPNQPNLPTNNPGQGNPGPTNQAS